jgi:hypothetical protein
MLNIPSFLNETKEYLWSPISKTQKCKLFSFQQQKQNIRNTKYASWYVKILSLEDIGCYEDIPETADTIEDAILKQIMYLLNTVTIVLLMIQV